jgi:hypothetical protein
MDRLVEDQLQGTVIHEAAHVAARFVFGLPLTDVFVDPDGLSYVAGTDSLVRTDFSAVVSLAGSLAEERGFGLDSDWEGLDPALCFEDDQSDSSAVMHLAVEATETDEAAVSLAFHWLDLARSLVESPHFWALVEALAPELLARRHLTPAESKIILESVK